MLRHFSYRILIDTRQFSKTTQIHSSLFTNHSRQCHQRELPFNEEYSNESSHEKYEDDYSRSGANYKRKPFNRFTANKRYSVPNDNQFENRFRSKYKEGNFYNEGKMFQRTSKLVNTFGNNEFGQNLKKAEFNNLEPVQKNFYVEHSRVAELSEDEVSSLRNKWNMKVQGSNAPKPITHFEELCLPDNLKQVVLNQGYSEPTPIQAQGWPTVLSGRDMVGISQTGSGKTLVYVLPAIIHALNQTSRERECQPQILVLAPTRELVQQILEVTNMFSDSVHLLSAAAYGGASKSNQLRSLQDAAICVATPGRLIDFVSEGVVCLRNCTYLVLDEADRMLDMGFEPQIRKIVNQIRPDRQTLMWSATWPKEIRMLAEDFLDDYVQVTVGAGQLVANPNIEQNVYIMEENDKFDRLIELLTMVSEEGNTKVLIFAQTKRTVNDLNFALNKEGVHAMCIHGDVSQLKRDTVLHNFRRKKSCILIATDVAARGLDITDIHHVINFDLPTNIEDYIHRIGRTARGASNGVSHSFFTAENVNIVKDLVDVLRQANQPVSNELMEMIPSRAVNNGRSNFRRRPFQLQKYGF